MIYAILMVFITLEIIHLLYIIAKGTTKEHIVPFISRHYEGLAMTLFFLLLLISWRD